MDIIYIQLDDGKKLEEEREVKNELSDSLRKAHIEQLPENQQENLEFNKLAQELHAMSLEICELRKLYGEVQSSLHQRDLLLNQISSTNGKLEAECNEKLLKLEGENRDLLLSSDEAFARIRDLEKKTASSSEEISGLKRLLSIKQQLNTETNKNASMDLKERDEYILKLEEENRVGRDQLKWKNEQFSHLEEAHEKLQTFFMESKSVWQKEKSSLLDEISSLQCALDAWVPASEGLEEELRRYKTMFDESKQCQSNLPQSLEPEDTGALKLKLQKSESEVEILKLNLKVNQQAHEQEKIGLLVTVNEKDAKIGNLEQQISMLKSVILAKSEAAEMLIQEKDSYVRLAEDRNCSIKNLQNEIAQLRNKLAEREVKNVAILNGTLRQENDGIIISSIEEKDQKTQELQKEYLDLQSATVSFVGNEYMVDEALKEAEGQKTLEVEEKEVNGLPEKSLLQLAEETKKSEIQELRSQVEKETRCFENLLNELESHKHALLDGRTEEKIKREYLLARLENMCQLIGFLCTEDAELMKLSLLYEEDSESHILINTSSPSRKSVQVSINERTPLAELNVRPLIVTKEP